MTPNPTEIADYEAQAREFLAKSREYLAAGDLHQASEKGWGAAAPHGQGRCHRAGLDL